jgi:hypothetical protein
MSPRRQRKWDRAQFIHDNCPAYYRGPFRRPSEFTDPLEALAWDETERWMTPREWLDRLRRSGRPYKVWGNKMPGRWEPMSRPCIRAHFYPASTKRLGFIP